MAELVLTRIAASMREDWRGTHLVLLPLLPWKPRFPKLSQFAQEIQWGADTQLFADSISGHRVWVPVVDEVRWAFFRLTKSASWGYFFFLRRSGTVS